MSKSNLQFVVLAPNEWNGQWMNRQQLFSRIGKSHDVVYGTGPMHHWERSSGRFEKAPSRYAVEERFNVSSLLTGQFPLRFARIGFLDKLVLNWYGKKITSALSEKSKDTARCLYIFHPKFAEFVDIIPHEKLVYHVYDDYSKQASYTKDMEAAEKKLLSQADVVFASSRSMKARLDAMAPKNDVVFLPNGVNYEQFATPKAEPEDLKPIQGFRVGYTGSINDKVDLALLDALAEQRPEVNFVMIGGKGRIGEHENYYAQLQERQNVHFLGSKDVTEIAAYMQHMNINTMMYRVDGKTWASSVYPLKMHEYLATGQSVISADIEAVREFEEVVQIATSPEQWCQFIDQQVAVVNQDDLDNNSPGTSITPEQRQRVASENTWEARVATVLSHISQQ